MITSVQVLLRCDPQMTSREKVISDQSKPVPQDDARQSFGLTAAKETSGRT